MTSKLTREQVIALIAEYSYDSALVDALEYLAAAMDGEPIYQYQSGVYNDDNGETDWYWDDCDKGFYEQYAHDRRRILYRHAQPVPEKATVGEMPFLGVSEGVYVRGWNDCRAAMLQARSLTGINPAPALVSFPKTGEVLTTNSPAQSDCSPAQNHVSPALNPIDHGYRPDCECSGCKATARICAELAGNSPVIPAGYVMVPMRLTAENGAKAALIGEFNLEYTLTCHECFGEGCYDCRVREHG